MSDFTFTIAAEELAKGLRPSAKSPRDKKFLVEAVGAVGRDGVLAAIDELTRMDTSEISDAFPFPQLFVFTNFIIVCSSTKIYEWNSGSLTLKHTATVQKSIWTAVDFYDYVYMSNGAVAVVRDATLGTYSETTDLPTTTSILNYNGQVIVGAPDTYVPGVNLSMLADELDITLTQHGDWT